MSAFSAQLKTPGGAFYLGSDGTFVWRADDEDAPPHVWGWHNLDMAAAYFTELLKTIRLAQEARRGKR